MRRQRNYDEDDDELQHENRSIADFGNEIVADYKVPVKWESVDEAIRNQYLNRKPGDIETARLFQHIRKRIMGDDPVLKTDLRQPPDPDVPGGYLSLSVGQLIQICTADIIKGYETERFDKLINKIASHTEILSQKSSISPLETHLLLLERFIGDLLIVSDVHIQTLKLLATYSPVVPEDERRAFKAIVNDGLRASRWGYITFDSFDAALSVVSDSTKSTVSEKAKNARSIFGKQFKKFPLRPDTSLTNFDRELATLKRKTSSNPRGFGRLPKLVLGNKSKLFCNYCKTYGHVVQNCPKDKAKKARLAADKLKASKTARPSKPATDNQGTSL